MTIIALVLNWAIANPTTCNKDAARDVSGLLELHYYYIHKFNMWSITWANILSEEKYNLNPYKEILRRLKKKKYKGERRSDMKKDVYTIRIFRGEDTNKASLEKEFIDNLEEFRETSSKYLQILKPGEIFQLQHYKQIGFFGWDFIIDIKCDLDGEMNKKVSVSLVRYDELEFYTDGKVWTFKHID